MRLQSSIVLGFFACLSVLGSGCKKDKLLTSGGELRFSTDTLTFDTVFSATGSFTTGLKIFNNSGQRVIISSVRLEKGSSSFFHLNVNGIAGNEVKDIEVAANDSIYVFATVNIDPTDENNPFVIDDKLIATLNGNDFSVPLIAFGQNAHYIVDSVITQNDTWLTDKPYVILHSALVDQGVTLTIPGGCRVYMNQDSRLLVRGTLKVNEFGSKNDTVIFQGDRLDRAYFGYEGYPGEWGGIYFDSSSTGNIINWTILRNCGNNSGGGLPFAIEVFGTPGPVPQLTLSHTIIENSIGYGILGFGGNIKADNCLVHTCGALALALFQGGTYSFGNCDFINYSTDKIAHIDNPTVAVLNYFDISNTEYLAGDLNASFTNCVIYGSVDNELFCNKKEGATYTAKFDHCLLKISDPLPPYVDTLGLIINQDPLFTDQPKWDYRPKAESPLKGTGVPPAAPEDLDGMSWITNDIGCYRIP
jgi:hypothetical protein